MELNTNYGTVVNVKDLDLLEVIIIGEKTKDDKIIFKQALTKGLVWGDKFCFCGHSIK